MARIRTTDDAGRVFNAYSPLFTLKHNAIRAARKALGANAMPYADFALDQAADGRWTWRAAVADDAPQTPVAVENKDRLAHQPAPKTVEELLRRIAVEHSLEGATLIIQALHTAYAEGLVHKPAPKPHKKRKAKKCLYLFDEPLIRAA